MAEMDAQGRVLLPQILRETAKLAGDAVVFGQQTYLEVANHDEFKQSMETDPLTADDETGMFWRAISGDLMLNGTFTTPQGGAHGPVASGMCRFFYKMRSDI